MAVKKDPRITCPVCSIQDITPGRKDVMRIEKSAIHIDCLKKKRAKIIMFQLLAEIIRKDPELLNPDDVIHIFERLFHKSYANDIILASAELRHDLSEGIRTSTLITPPNPMLTSEKQKDNQDEKYFRALDNAIEIYYFLNMFSS